MSNHDMAQQAERKRRFSEQKKETQWQQVHYLLDWQAAGLMSFAGLPCPSASLSGLI